MTAGAPQDIGSGRVCVGVFGYARPKHLRRCLDSLSTCPEAKRVAVHIYCDGPPVNADVTLLTDIAETRAVATDTSGFRSISLFFSPEHQGVARAVPAGVDHMLSNNDQAIVLEDDLEVSRFFLTYMLRGLELYADESRVMAISGYTWPTFEDETSATYFSKFAHYWGWATWRRAWRSYSPDGLLLRKALANQGLLADFDTCSVFPRTSTQILDLYISNEMGIWDICWSATVLINRGLCLYPRKSLVRNHGFDGSGMHCRKFATVPFELQELAAEPIEILSGQDVIEDSKEVENYRAMRELLLHAFV